MAKGKLKKKVFITPEKPSNEKTSWVEDEKERKKSKAKAKKVKA